MKLNQQKIAPYVFLSPFFLLFMVFGIFPIGYSVVISLFKWRNIGPEEFVLFKNFTRFFKAKSPDLLFIKSLVNTLIFLLFGSITQHFFAIPLAMLLNNRTIRGKDFFKTTYFLPFITNAVSVTMIFGMLYDFNYGWLNYLLKTFGFEAFKWKQSAVGIKVSVSILLNWRFIGYYTVIYLAGLQAIPNELYESAKIDGATIVRQHLSITLPMLVPMIFFAMSLTLIFGMQLFAEPFALTGGYAGLGGIGNSGMTSTFLVMLLGFKMSRFGRASAVAWLMFMVILVFTLINKIVTDKFDYTKEKPIK